MNKADAEAKAWNVTEYINSLTSVTTVAAEAQVVSTIYYDMNGRTMTAAPEHGIYIARDVMSNGTVVARKVMK